MLSSRRIRLQNTFRPSTAPTHESFICLFIILMGFVTTGLSFFYDSVSRYDSFYSICMSRFRFPLIRYWCRRSGPNGFSDDVSEAIILGRIVCSGLLDFWHGIDELEWMNSHSAFCVSIIPSQVINCFPQFASCNDAQAHLSRKILERSSHRISMNDRTFALIRIERCISRDVQRRILTR